MNVTVYSCLFCVHMGGIFMTDSLKYKQVCFSKFGLDTLIMFIIHYTLAISKKHLASLLLPQNAAHSSEYGQPES